MEPVLSAALAAHGEALAIVCACLLGIYFIDRFAHRPIMRRLLHGRPRPELPRNVAWAQMGAAQLAAVAATLSVDGFNAKLVVYLVTLYVVYAVGGTILVARAPQT